MISKRLKAYVVAGTFLGVLAIPMIAMAAEATAAAPVTMAGAVKTLAAALARAGTVQDRFCWSGHARRAPR